jgi:hypothetical protein
MHGQIINTIDMRHDEHHFIIATFLEILAIIFLYVIAQNSLHIIHHAYANGQSRNRH